MVVNHCSCQLYMVVWTWVFLGETRSSSPCTTVSNYRPLVRNSRLIPWSNGFYGVSIVWGCLFNELGSHPSLVRLDLESVRNNEILLLLLFCTLLFLFFYFLLECIVLFRHGTKTHICGCLPEPILIWWVSRPSLGFSSIWKHGYETTNEDIGTHLKLIPNPSRKQKITLLLIDIFHVIKIVIDI